MEEDTGEEHATITRDEATLLDKDTRKPKEENMTLKKKKKANPDSSTITKREDQPTRPCEIHHEKRGRKKKRKLFEIRIHFVSHKESQNLKVMLNIALLLF